MHNVPDELLPSARTLFYLVSLYLFPNLYSHIHSLFTPIASQIYFTPFSSSPVLLLPCLWLRIMVATSSLPPSTPSNGRSISPHIQPPILTSLKRWAIKSLTLLQPSSQLYSLPVIKTKAEFVYRSSLSRYKHNQMLVYVVFIQQAGKKPSQLTLPYCTQVCKQHDPFPRRVTEHLPHFTENSSSNHK